MEEPTINDNDITAAALDIPPAWNEEETKQPQKQSPTVGFSSPPNLSSANLDQLEQILKEKGLIKELRTTLNLIAIPLLILATIGIGFILKWAEDILVPFVIAIFFTYLLRPSVNCLSRPFGECNRVSCRGSRYTHASDVEMAGLLGQSVDDDYNNGKTKRASEDFDDIPRNVHASKPKFSLCMRCLAAKCPRWLAVALSLVWVVGILSGLVILIADAVQSFEQQHLVDYENRTMELLNKILEMLKRNFDVNGSYMLEQIEGEFHVVAFTKSLLLYIVNGIAYTFIILLFVLYMLFEESDGDRDGVNRSHHRAASLRKQIDAQIQRYLVIKTIISGVVGVLVYVVLGPILNVKMAHLFGVITFLANFIPNVGAIIATLLPIPVVLLDPTQSTLTILLSFIIPVSIHTVVGNIVEPKVFGDQMELHPVVVMLSLSFWFTVWGVPGAILSVPITAVIRIIVSNIKHPYTKVALKLLEGKLPGSAEFHA